MRDMPRKNATLTPPLGLAHAVHFVPGRGGASMRYGQSLLAVFAGVMFGAHEARAEEPPIVVQPAPDQKVVVEPPAPPPAAPVVVTPPPVVEAAPVYAPPPPAPAAPPPGYHKPRKHSKWFAPGQASVTVGGGVADFVGGSMRNATEIGAEWDARVTIGTRSLVAFEAGYAGTYNKLQSPV